MGHIRAADIAAMTGGRLLGNGEAECSGFFIDSRRVTPGALFTAIRSQKADGHSYIGAAFEAGAAAVLSQEEYSAPQGRAVIVVDDTQKALMRLGGAWRDRFSIPVIGVTGSVGKTTTKEFIYAVLSSRFKTCRTEGNLNNELGLPLSLLSLEEGDEAAVFEMGMSGFGEIATMAAAARPSIGVITNIGTAHIEMLGSRENIRAAKLEITQGMAPDSILLLNADEPLLWKKRGKMGSIKTLFYGIDNKEADLTAKHIVQGDESMKIEIRGMFGLECTVPAVGRHNVYNVLAAAFCGRLLGLRRAEIAKGLMSFKGAAMRQNIMKKGGVTVIDDCYNANPDSMRAAISVLCSGEGRKIAVLGDMLELGDYARTAHEEIGAFCAANGVDMLAARGSSASVYAEGFVKAGGSPENARVFKDDEQTAAFLKEFVNKGDRVLFKGSRSTRMENVLRLTFGE